MEQMLRRYLHLKVRILFLEIFKKSLQHLTDRLYKASESERLKHLAASIHLTYGIQPNEYFKF